MGNYRYGMRFVVDRDGKSMDQCISLYSNTHDAFVSNRAAGNGIDMTNFLLICVVVMVGARTVLMSCMCVYISCMVNVGI